MDNPNGSPFMVGEKQRAWLKLFLSVMPLAGNWLTLIAAMQQCIIAWLTIADAVSGRCYLTADSLLRGRR